VPLFLNFSENILTKNKNMVKYKLWKEKMDMLNKDTFEILEERKKYLLQKKQKNGDDINKNGYINREIGALDRVINFTKLVLKNFPKETIENMINKYELDNINDYSKDLNTENECEIIYTYEKEIMTTYKINISFIKQNTRKYILIEPKKYVIGKNKWENRGKYRITPTIMEEILRKWNEMEII
jgi:hypothetical protein